MGAQFVGKLVSGQAVRGGFEGLFECAAEKSRRW
jgi:hypothetical protein